jgi:hypothetical protein
MANHETDWLVIIRLLLLRQVRHTAKKWLFYLTQFCEKIFLLIANKIFKSTTLRNLVYLTDYVSCKNVIAYKKNNDGSKLT